MPGKKWAKKQAEKYVPDSLKRSNFQARNKKMALWICFDFYLIKISILTFHVFDGKGDTTE